MHKAVGRRLPFPARQVDEALARHVAAIGQRGHARQPVPRRGARGGRRRGKKLREHRAVPVPGPGPGPGPASMERRPNRLREQRFFPAYELVFPQAEDLAHGPHHTGVERHAARERHRRLDGQPANDERLEALDHGVAEAEQDILHGRALLLAMDDVGLCEHRAPPGDPRHRPGARDQLGIILDGEPESRHLVLEERARARSAALVHGELRHLTVADAVDVAGVLPAHRNNGANRRRQSRHATGDGGDVLEHRQRAGTCGLGERAGGRARGACAYAGVRAELRSQTGKKLARRAHGLAAMRDATAPQQPRRPVALAGTAARGHSDHLDRARARVYANGEVHVVLLFGCAIGPGRSDLGDWV